LPKAHRTETQKPAASQEKRLEHGLPAHRPGYLVTLLSNSQWSIITMLSLETRRYKGFLNDPSPDFAHLYSSCLWCA
jgi:hypothetical protein